MTGPINASEDWQTACIQLHQRTDHLLESGYQADCCFEVGAARAIVRAHKLLLGAASPVFDAMFYGGLPVEDPVRIVDIQPDAFKAFLRYIYTEKVQINSLEVCWGLYYSADKYLVPHLKPRCMAFYNTAVNAKNVCQEFERAEQFNSKEFDDLCKGIIKRKTKEVLKSKGFDSVKLSTLVMIFSLTNLNLSSEIELFQALEKYVQAQGAKTAKRAAGPLKGTGSAKKAKVTADGEKAGKKRMRDKLLDVCEADADRKEGITQDSQSKDVHSGNTNDTSLTIHNVLQMIQFLTLTPKEFADGPAKSSLLTDQEKYSILMNISSESCHVPMPDGFSSSREKNRYGYYYSPTSPAYYGNTCPTYDSSSSD